MSIPILPDEIAELLDDTTPAEDSATDQQVKAFLEEHQGDERSEIIHGWRAAWAKHMTDGDSRHPSMVSVLVGALKEARAGYFPAAAAEHMLRQLFIEAKTRPPINDETQLTADEADSAFDGILAWAVAQANAADLEQVRARTNEKMPNNVAWVQHLASTNGSPQPAAEPITLDAAHVVFTKWLGKDYDTDAIDTVLATLAAERLDGDPLWLLLISGSGNAKTETVQAAAGIGAIITSTVTSDAALLSATPAKERTKGATGGLLRLLEPRGVLVIKDVTSILSMSRETRGMVLSALREIHDGSWSRDVGTDGGHRLTWKGRIAIIGAVTTAWDAAHAVVSSMGDRFVLIRVDSTKCRMPAGRKAIRNTGDETAMRAELAAAVAAVITGMNPDPITVTDIESERILEAADLVTLARTSVEYDYRGDVIDSHAPEMPTRFAKQLTQIIRGGVSIGMDRRHALRLAIRCARDSMPPMRLLIVDDIAEHPDSTASDVRKRINKPRATVDRQLQALHMLGVCQCDEEPYGVDKVRWYYSLADGISPAALDPKSLPDLSVHTPNPNGESVSEDDSLQGVTDKSGEDPDDPAEKFADSGEQGHFEWHGAGPNPYQEYR
jgi:hypothetical protein